MHIGDCRAMRSWILCGFRILSTRDERHSKGVGSFIIYQKAWHAFLIHKHFGFRLAEQENRASVYLYTCSIYITTESSIYRLISGSSSCFNSRETLVSKHSCSTHRSAFGAVRPIQDIVPWIAFVFRRKSTEAWRLYRSHVKE